MAYTTLISPTELAHNLFNPNWIILDCRHELADPAGGLNAYHADHITGAQFAHTDRDLSGGKIDASGAFRGRHPLPERSAFIETLRRWGFNDDTQAVVYDAQGGIFAARLWWMLRWAGHSAVAVLDGGFPAWVAQAFPVSANQQARAPGKLSDRPSLVSTVDTADLIANLAQPVLKVIDARAPDRFRGENETLDPVGGHIPGAQNRFYKDNLLPDGRFKPSGQLRTEFSSMIDTPTSSVMQCGSGITACHNLLALEIAGLPGAALYPGSWSEWCADTSRPVANGS